MNEENKEERKLKKWGMLNKMVNKSLPLCGSRKRLPLCGNEQSLPLCGSRKRLSLCGNQQSLSLCGTRISFLCVAANKGFERKIYCGIKARAEDALGGFNLMS